MAIQRLDLLVRQARARSGNREFGDGQGVPQRDYVAYANDAQARIYNLIMQCRPTLFLKQAFITTLSGVAEYTLPTDVYLKHNLVTVQYTPNGNPQLYYPLNQRLQRSEVSIPALPDSYFLRDGKLVLSPIPMTGYTNAIRYTYQYSIPTLDIRRARIDQIINVGSGEAQIFLQEDSLLTEENVNDLSNEWVDYVCVVNKDGTIVDEGMSLVGYQAGGSLVLPSIYCETSTGADALAQVGDFIVFGKRATTHSPLPDICERYLVEYMTLRSQASDTSSETSVTSTLLRSIEAEIVDAIEMLEEDIFSIPILDPQFMNYAEDWED